jgi:hypothetical protein
MPVDDPLPLRGLACCGGWTMQACNVVATSLHQARIGFHELATVMLLYASYTG